MTARENMLTVRVSVDKQTQARMPGLVEREVRKQVARQMTERLGAMVKKTEGEYADEYNLSLYVLTPNELHKLVHELAQRSSMGMPIVGGFASYDSAQREDF
jgi:hypothetical protein